MFTVEVIASGAMDLGAMEFTLGYDAERLELMEVHPGNLPANTGRSVAAVGPISDAKAGTVTYGLYTLGNAPPGPDGNGSLAQLTFRARRVGHSALVLQRAQVTDVSGKPAAGLMQSGGVTVAEAKAWVWLPVLVSPGR
jgi:hypothetical protein